MRRVKKHTFKKEVKTLCLKKFGFEIEFTGIIRNKVSKLVAVYLNGMISEPGDYYDSKVITASDERKWKMMYDDSLRCHIKKKRRGY